MKLKNITFICVLFLAITSCKSDSGQSSIDNNYITCYHQVLQYPNEELPLNVYTEVSDIATKELTNNPNIRVNEVVLSKYNLSEYAKFNPRNGIITYIKFSELIFHWNHISISKDTESMIKSIPLMKIAVAQCEDSYNKNLIERQLEYFEQLISKSN